MKATPNRRPVRTCVACRQEAGKSGLLRLVRAPTGEVGIDLTGRAHGRGAYLHATAECIELARNRRALERALKAPVHPSLWGNLETHVESFIRA